MATFTAGPLGTSSAAWSGATVGAPLILVFNDGGVNASVSGWTRIAKDNQIEVWTRFAASTSGTASLPASTRAARIVVVSGGPVPTDGYIGTAGSFASISIPAGDDYCVIFGQANFGGAASIAASLPGGTGAQLLDAPASGTGLRYAAAAFGAVAGSTGAATVSIAGATLQYAVIVPVNGAEQHSGGALSAVTVGGLGNGSKLSSGGYLTAVTIGAVGGGYPSAPAFSTVTVGASGSGSKASAGGAVSSVMLFNGGFGFKTAVGGGVSTVGVGAIGGGVIVLPDPLLVLTSQRTESWEWRLLDLSGGQIGTLDGLGDATLTWSTDATIKGGGSVPYNGPELDWLHVMIQPIYHVDGEHGGMSWPMGVFIPSTPTGEYADTGLSRTLELYDKLTILDSDKVEAPFVAGLGANVTDLIRSIVTSAGGGLFAGVDSAETLPAAVTWAAGTSKLQIANDLLEAINYFSLWVDWQGTFQLRPYSDTTSRPVVWEFADDAQGIYLPDFTREQDLFDIPNKVIEIGNPPDAPEDDSSGDDSGDPPPDPPPLIGVYENVSDGPTSYEARGRWVTTVDSDVEATSQDVIDQIAQRRWRELASPSATVEFKHAVIPLQLNDIVTFKNNRHGVTSRATVTSMEIDTSTGALCSTKVQEVVN